MPHISAQKIWMIDFPIYYSKEKTSNHGDFIMVTSPNRNHIVALRRDETITGWGPQSTHDAFPIIGRAKKVFSNDFCAAALTKDGGTWIWGSLNFFRFGGHGRSAAFIEKQQDPIVHVDPGLYRTFFTTKSGKVGVLDSGSSSGNAHISYVHLESYENVSMTSTGGIRVDYGNAYDSSHTMVLTKSGWLCGFGNNDFGQCEVPERGPFLAVEAGNGFSAALKNDGTIVMWGRMHCRKSGDEEIVWDTPWTLSEEAMVKFVMDYGHLIHIRRIPRWAKRKNDFNAMRRMQRMLRA